MWNFALAFAFVIGAMGRPSGTTVPLEGSVVFDSAPDSELPHAVSRTQSEPYKVLGITWDPLRKQTVAKIAAGTHVILFTSAQRLPTPSSKFAHASSAGVERLTAGTECDLVSGSTAMRLALKGVAMHTAEAGKVTTLRLVGLDNRVVEARVIDAHHAQVLP